MNTTIVRGQITEEQFRQNDKHRDSLNAFLDTEAGAAFLYILRNKARARGSSTPVSPDAIEILSVTELARLRGIDEVIVLLENLCQKVEITGRIARPESLGDHPEDSRFMPPEFKVQKVPTPTTK